MRKRFEIQYELGQTPIEEVQINLKSRDELAPTLRGLQWIFETPEVHEQIFSLLESKICSEKKETGRPGMTLWQMLVLGVVRLSLDCNYDRLEHIAHYDMLVRQIMGLPSDFGGVFKKGFHHKTLSENICHIDESLLQEVNEIIVKSGQKGFKKKEEEKLTIKSDTYVLETNVHFPTDLNLLWDASRKVIELLSDFFKEGAYRCGWRKADLWKRQLKSLYLRSTRIQHGGGSNKEYRFHKAVKKYLAKARSLDRKVSLDLENLSKGHGLSKLQIMRLNEVEYYHSMLVKHLDLVNRRILKGEKIPHEEKVFSLFEPHTEWISKGKLHSPVELGRKLLISTDQFGLIVDYKIMKKSSDSEESLDLSERLLTRFGDNSIESFSVDKGFSNEAHRQVLEESIPKVIMLKKGKRSLKDCERESEKSFKRLRRKHSAIESNIFCLEKHGLNRCPDKGEHGFKRYVGLGVLAYNLHKIGKRLIEYQHVLKKAA